MPSLKSRQAGIPGGFQFVQPETNWDTENLPDVKGRSFDTVVKAIIKHREGNSWLAKKHGWLLHYESVANELDAYNALRMQSNPKWQHFISDDYGGSSASIPFRFPSQYQPANAVGAVKKVAAGVKVLLDWLGSGGRAVPKEQAEKRAAICVLCPQNKDGDWTTIFTKPVSEMLRLQLGIKNDLKLATGKDEQLYVCAACSCPNRLKVWTEIKHIKENMDKETQDRLQKENPKCWILTEIEQGSSVK